MRLNYYHKILIVAAVGIFYTNVPVYLYDHYGLAGLGAPKYWVMLFCLLSCPVLFRQWTAWNALKSPVAIWCFGYAVLTVLWFFLSSQSEMPWQEVRNRFQAIIEIIIFLLVFWDPDAVRWARRTLVAAVLLGVALNIYELFAPLSFSPVIGRSAGLYINPNMAAEALVPGMIVAVTILKSKYRAPFILLVGLGVFLTLSRGRIAAWVLAVAGLIFTRIISPRDLVRSGIIAFALGVLLILPRWDQLLTTWERTGVVNANVLERLAWFSDPADVSDQSAWERQYVVKRAWDKVAEAPFLGTGTGSSHEAYVETHNQSLSLMVDHGVLGMIIFPLLIFAASWGARGETRQVAIVFGGTIMMISFFGHTLLYQSCTLVVFSLMAAMTAMGGHREVKKIMETEMRAAGQDHARRLHAAPG